MVNPFPVRILVDSPGIPLLNCSHGGWDSEPCYPSLGGILNKERLIRNRGLLVLRYFHVNHFKGTFIFINIAFSTVVSGLHSSNMNDMMYFVGGRTFAICIE